MARKRRTGGAGDYVRSFATEDGEHYRVHHQELGPAMKRVEQIKQAQDAAKGKVYNPTDRTYIGSVPVTVLTDWLQAHGYTIDQFARREGTIRQDFMKYFLSRDFSKLHTQHTTTRRESGRIVVPDYIGREHGTDKLRSTEGSDS